MKTLGKLILYPALGVNALFMGTMILCAYSWLIQPQAHPIASALGLAFPLFLALNAIFLVFWLCVRYRYALLPLAGILVCLPQIRAYFPLNPLAGDPPEEHIKILSYNVMSFAHVRKVNGKSPILTYLQESGADIICLQEYYVSANNKEVTGKDVMEALKAYPYSTILKEKQNGIHLACFSKYPILSNTPIQYKSNYNSSSLYTLKIGNDTLTLINNHLESNNLTYKDRNMYEDLIEAPNAEKVKTSFPQLLGKLVKASAIRADQADSVAQAIARSPYPNIIACGDFNDGPISYVNGELGKLLDNAFVRSGNGAGISYNRNKFYFRIDNILVSHNLKAYHCTVDRSIKASDHYPIWCYVSKRDRN
ncbi:MAG: endonuclease/exonuclease/phosphatase family protein [Mediterranea sp.]|jgi:endonuclease/exonuclease/phosphatase family metal-dependent hydrolase|nr:endonuclease/exonuclease/phosphatase family protein [Mediterranea sp.]